MENDLQFFENGRRPQFSGKWKKTQKNQPGRQPQFIFQMEDDLKENNAT